MQVMTDSQSYWVESEDWHTAGEPFRIVQNVPPGLMPEMPTVTERYHNIIDTKDHPLDKLRKFLSHEPRGHADMYGGFITTPNDSGAHFGVLFWHIDGFATACGHGTIALGYWAVHNHLVDAPENGIVDVVVDVPSGRVVATIAIENGKSIYADFVNVSSYQIAKGLSVTIPSRDAPVSVDLSFCGGVSASVNATQLSLKVEPENAYQFAKLQREIKASLGDRARYNNAGLYTMLFFEEDEYRQEADLVIQKSVNIYGDGQIDRSPCGSGTCGRVAILLAEGRFQGENARFLHHSIIGSTFEAKIVSRGESPSQEFPACVVRVRGQAYLVAQTRFFINTEDPLSPGFVLR